VKTFCWNVGAEYESPIIETSTTALSANPAVAVPLLTINSWILMQRNTVGSVTLRQMWAAYRDGIGAPTGTDGYWLGLEKIYHLTQIGSLRLRVEVQKVQVDLEVSQTQG